MDRLIFTALLLGSSALVACQASVPPADGNTELVVDHGASIHLLKGAFPLLAERVRASFPEANDSEWLLSTSVETPDGMIEVSGTAHIGEITIDPLHDGSLHGTIALSTLQVLSPVDAPGCFPDQFVPEAIASFTIVPALTKNQELVFVEEDPIPLAIFEEFTPESPCTDPETGFNPVDAALHQLSESIVTHAASALGLFLTDSLEVGEVRLQWRTPGGTLADWSLGSPLSSPEETVLLEDGAGLTAPLGLRMGGPEHPCTPPFTPSPLLMPELPSFGHQFTGPLEGEPTHLFQVHVSELEGIAREAYRTGFFCHRTPLPETLRLGDLPVSDSLKELFGHDAPIEIRIQPILPPKVNLGDAGEDGALSIHILFGRIRIEVYALLNGSPIRLHVMESAASVAMGQQTQSSGEVLPLALRDVQTSQSSFSESAFGPPPGETEALAKSVLEAVFMELLSPVATALSWSPFVLTNALNPLPAFRHQSDYAVFPYRVESELP